MDLIQKLYFNHVYNSNALELHLYFIKFKERTASKKEISVSRDAYVNFGDLCISMYILFYVFLQINLILKYDSER